MKRSILASAVTAAVLVFPAGRVFAQSPTTGAIAGVVMDTTGAVLPGVTVEAASPATRPNDILNVDFMPCLPFCETIRMTASEPTPISSRGTQRAPSVLSNFV